MVLKYVLYDNSFIFACNIFEFCTQNKVDFIIFPLFKGLQPTIHHQNLEEDSHILKMGQLDFVGALANI